MSGARVQSIDSLRHFRASLIKFAEMANVAMGDAQGEISRMVIWLSTEQQTYWQGQIRKRQELVVRCKDAVRAKKLFKDSSGREQSAVDEEKQLLKAQRSLENAEQKLAATKRHSAKLQKELHTYIGSTQRMMTAVSLDIPNAVGMLDNMANSLDAYVNLSGGSSPEQPTAAPTGEDTMRRGDVGAENVAKTDESEGATTESSAPDEKSTPAAETQVDDSAANPTTSS